jgi:hypothetical protein
MFDLLDDQDDRAPSDRFTSQFLIERAPPARLTSPSLLARVVTFKKGFKAQSQSYLSGRGSDGRINLRSEMVDSNH